MPKKQILGIEYKKLAGLAGVLVTVGLFCLLLLFFIPRSTDIDEPIEVGGDAVVNTIGTAYTLIDLHSVSALWSGRTMVIVFVILLVTGCCCKNKALKTVHSHMSKKLKDEFISLSSEIADTYKSIDSSKTHDKVQGVARVGVTAACSVLGVESAVSRQGQQDKQARRDRMRQEMEDLEDEEARMEVAHKRALLDAKRRNQGGDVYGQHPVGYGDRDGVVYGRHAEGGAAGGGSLFHRGAMTYRGKTYADYQGVMAPVEHRAMVYAPGGRGRGCGTSSRFGVEVNDLSLVGQQIYSSLT